MANNNFIQDIVSPNNEPERPVRLDKKVVQSDTNRLNRDILVPREELTSSEETELLNANREIDTNPFLMRYARHAVTQESDMPEVRTPNVATVSELKLPSTPKETFRKINRDGGSKSGKGVWVFATICLIALVYALSFVFVRATVTVTPYSEPLSIDEKFEANKDASTGLPFSVMAVDMSDKADVVSTGSTTSDKLATGKVILYNAYSTSKQNLLINTRLEATNGKIYMTDIAVSIPGYTKKGETVVPGQLEVGVHATESGETYNTGMTDFKFVGFKTQADKYAKFYGRSKTAIEGGSTGLVYTITPEERSEQENLIIESLKEKAITQVMAEVPAGYIVFDDAVFYEQSSTVNSLQSKEVSIPIVVTLKVTAFMFSKDALISTIGTRTTLATHTDKKFDIPNLEDFTFKLDSKDLILPNTASKISFTLTGEGKANAIIDIDSFVKSLITRKVRDVDTILLNYPSILSAKVAMHPLWHRSFPDKTEHINVILAD